MRMLLDVKIPHEAFNAAVRDGSAGEKLKRIPRGHEAGGGLLH